MRNMKVKTKLLLGFIIVIILSSAADTIGIISILNINTANTNLYENKTKSISDIICILDFAQNICVESNNLVLNMGDIRGKNEIEIKLKEALENFKKYISSYDKTITHPEARKVFDEVKNLSSKEFEPSVQALMAAVNEGTEIQFLIPMTANTAGIKERIAENVKKCIEIRIGETKTVLDSNAAEAETALFIIVAVLTFSVISALILAFYISNQISMPLKALSSVLLKFGMEGDLAMSADKQEYLEKHAKNKDEVGQCIHGGSLLYAHINDINMNLNKLAAGDPTAKVTELSSKDTLGINFNNMTITLNKIFKELQTASKHVLSGSQQVSQSSQTLAGSSAEQALSIEEFTASITALENNMQLTAHNSMKAQDENERAGLMLAESIESMDKMSIAMKDIDESSKKITKIIKVIDDIAFQTNILALNAAVEAARAGSTGRGFAVVAEEVRNLAIKSANAAKETSNLIEGSIVKVKEGNEIVAKTNISLKSTVTGAQEAIRLLKEVALESSKQVRSIEEINQNISQISSTVQSNSSIAEEASAVAEEMAAQSSSLDEIVAKFKIKGSNYNKL